MRIGLLRVDWTWRDRVWQFYRSRSGSLIILDIGALRVMWGEEPV